MPQRPQKIHRAIRMLKRNCGRVVGVTAEPAIKIEKMMVIIIMLAIIFLLTGLQGLLGWALTGSLGGLLMGIPGGVVLIAFTTGFLLPLKILVAFLQAFIFCMLSMLYLAGATEDAEHH